MSKDKENKKEDFSHLSPKAQEDCILIKNAIAGDRSAYEIILKKYKHSLYATVFKVVKFRDAAEDIVIETFAKAFLKLNEYNPKFAFSTWLFRMGINKAIDYLRNRKNLNTSSIDEFMNEDTPSTFAGQLVSPNDDPIQDLLKQEKITFIRFIVEKLSPRYKRVIEMYYYQDMSCEEIAKELDTTTNNVKAELFRARKIMYNIIVSIKRDD